MRLNPFARITLATHYYATGPAMDLEGFLQGRTDELIFVAHPLFEGAGESLCRIYRAGMLVDSWTRRHSAGVQGFVEDLWRTVRWHRRGSGVSDLFIGGDNLLALAGLWLRWRGRVRTVVLYSIDFVPTRFENRLLNRLYHAIDAFAAEHVDVVWNVSPEIERARRERDGARHVAPQIVVPVGAHVGRITRGPAAIESRHEIAFMGHLLEKQGLQLAIEAMPLIRARVPDASLRVIGDGPFAPTLKSLAEERGVADAVEFSGFVEDHEKIEWMLARSALAIAPYTPDPMSFTRFADPGKIKTYLACGLPVVMTDVAAIGAEVQAAGAGCVIPYELQALADAVVSYLTNPVRLEAARAAAARLGETFDYDIIFASALQATDELVKR